MQLSGLVFNPKAMKRSEWSPEMQQVLACSREPASRQFDINNFED